MNATVHGLHPGTESTTTSGRGAATRGPLAFLASPELLVLGYLASVLFSFKIVLYVALAGSLLGMRWMITGPRLATYLLLASSVLLFFATAENVNATLTALLVFLGLFCSPSAREAKTSGHRALTVLSILVLTFSYYLTNVFDFNDGVVSHNFIPIIGLYLLAASMPASRNAMALASAVFAILVFSAGSRSGALVFLLLSLYTFSPRVALAALVIGFFVFLLGPSAEVLPEQFQRNYETEADPRLFIWAEFLNAAVSSDLFRRETFDFMDAFGLDRNFHNSLLEAYYRVGPAVAVLLLSHARLLAKVRHDRVPFAVFTALLFKAFFDTFLWFTPVDLIVFKAYGSALFGPRTAAAGSNA